MQANHQSPLQLPWNPSTRIKMPTPGTHDQLADTVNNKH